jgi:WD40 repeat protein
VVVGDTEGPDRVEQRGEGASTILSRGGGTDPALAGAVLDPGSVVAGYVVEALAGAGGMGVVYRATDPELGRQVALKLVAPERAQDPRFRELFVRESLVAAGLEHPNVIPIYRAGEDEGRLYIAMRYVEGASLQDLIAERGRVPPGRAARVVARVADALDAAHARGLVHRDVKPANVLIADPDGEEHVYLTDFGLSAGMSAGREGPQGGWAGTLAYLAPEQIRGGPIDARSDVYALGCVLFHALAGQPPFPTADEAKALEAHLTEAPPRLADVAPGLPPALDDVVRRAMAKRPEDRFATAGELGRAALAARYDVAILRAEADADPAREIAAGLAEAGLQPFVAEGGSPREAAEGVGASSACVVLVGRDGFGEWAREGLAAAKEISGRDRAFRTVLVLLPGGPDPVDPSLAFLATDPWIDLRAGVADLHGVEDLVRVLRGAEVGPGLVAAATEACPYRGLEAFREEDAGLFFGREEDVARLVERLRGTRFLAVLGPSGSGKSSLVAAGLIPAVRGGALPGGEGWRVLEMAPGTRPLAALAVRLGHLPGSGSPRAADLASDERSLDLAVARALDGRPDDARVLLVVDQLEEAFTLCQDEGERAAFLGNLMYAATIPGGRTVVVVAMRADFYGRLAERPELRSLVAAQQVLLGPLDARGLRRAIEQPAKSAGLELEPGLTRRILTDVADRPGTLPLMEHLLLEVWQRRRGRTLTLEAYAASGGVEGALARRANSIYGAMSPERQAVARRVLLRLTQPGEGTEDTRRRATRRELITRPGEDAEVDAVIASLAEARLLTTGRDEATGEPVVDVTHEALIRGWPELRGWINDDREQLRLHRRLSDAATDWDAGGRDDGQLYRGAPLAVWEGRDESDLNELERAFLAASRERAERERATRRRRTRITIGALAAGLAIVAVLAVLALLSRQDAADQRDLAQSRQLATESQTQLATDPELATLLAAEAYDADPSPEAEAALRQAVHDSKVRGALYLEGELPLTVMPGPDGQAAVGADGGALRLWDPAADPRGASAATLGTWPGGINTMVRTEDGYLTGGNDGAVVAWPASTGGAAPRVVARMGGGVYSVRVAPDGERILAAGDGGVIERDLATGRTRTIASGGFFGAEFDVLPGVVYTTGPDGRLLRWRPGAAQGEQVTIPGTAQIMGASPDGRLLGVGTGQGLVMLRLGEEPRVVFSAPFEGGVNSAAFGPAGLVAAAGGDGSVRVLDASGEVLARMTGHEGPVAGVSFLGRDRVVSVGVDGSARTWAWADGREPRLQSEPLPESGGVAFLPQGRVAVVAGDGSARAWTPPASTARELLPTDAAGAAAAAVSDNGRLIATGAPDGTLLVREPGGARVGTWALGNLPNDLAWTPDGRSVAAALLGGEVATVAIGSVAGPRVLGPHAEDATAVAARPGDGTIASGGRDGVVRLWDGTEGGRLVADLDAQINALAFNADGRLAVAVGDETVRIYDTGGGDEPTVLRGRFGITSSVAFSEDGAELAAGSDQGLRIWDWRRGVILLTVPRGNGVRSLAATGSEPRIASYGFDDVVQVTTCDVCGPIDEVLALVPTRTTRALTDEERTDFKTGG